MRRGLCLGLLISQACRTEVGSLASRGVDGQIPCSGVVAFVGSDSLESQGCCRELHPVVGGSVHLSRRAVFGWWLSYLSSPPGGPVLSATWHRDGACSKTVVLSVLAERAGVAVLVRVGVPDGARPLLPLSGVGMEERSCDTAWCVMKGEGGGHGQLLTVVFGPVLHNLVGP
jgi:hypothetical protein